MSGAMCSLGGTRNTATVSRSFSNTTTVVGDILVVVRLILVHATTTSYLIVLMGCE